MRIRIIDICTKTTTMNSSDNAVVNERKKKTSFTSTAAVAETDLKTQPCTGAPTSPGDGAVIATASLTATSSSTSISMTSSTFVKEKDNAEEIKEFSIASSPSEENMPNRKIESRENNNAWGENVGHNFMDGNHSHPQDREQHQEKDQPATPHQHQQYRKGKDMNEPPTSALMTDAAKKYLTLATQMRINAERAQYDTNQTILHLQEALDLAKQNKNRIDNELADAIRNEEKAKQYYHEQQHLKEGGSNDYNNSTEYPKNIDSINETNGKDENNKINPTNQHQDYIIRSSNSADANNHNELNSKRLRGVTVHVDSTSDDTVSEFSVSTLRDDSLLTSSSTPLPLLHTFHGHDCMVLTVAVLHDNKSFVSGSVDGLIKHWSAIEGKCIRTFPKHHTGAVTCVHSMGDRDCFLSGSEDESIILWNYVTGECEQIFVGHRGAVWSVIQSGTHQFISASGDTTIKLWDVLDNNNSNSSSIKLWDVLENYSSNNRTTCGRRRSSIKKNNKCLRTFVGHKGAVFTLAIVGQGRFISGSSDRTIKYWSLSQPSCLRTFDGHNGNLQSVMRVDRKRFISSAEDKTIKVWSTSTGDCIATHFIKHTSANKNNDNTALSVAFITKDQFVSGCTNGTVELWNLSKGKCIDSFVLHSKDVCSIAAIGNGCFISASMDNTIKLWALDLDELEKDNC